MRRGRGADAEHGDMAEIRLLESRKLRHELEVGRHAEEIGDAGRRRR